MFQHLQNLIAGHRAGTFATAVSVSAGAAALLPPAAAAAVVAAAMLLQGRRPAPSGPRDHVLRRHLAICRRREERALILVATAPGRAPAITAELRISDSAIVERRRGRSVLVAVLDERELSRERIDQRLRQKHGERLTVGWATYPDDGVTLDVLVELATARAAFVPAPAGTVPALLDRVAALDKPIAMLERTPQRRAAGEWT